MKIPGLRGLGPAALIKQSVMGFIEDDMVTHAAALAYYILFSLFPFMIFLIALLGLLNIPEFFDWLLDQAQAVVPEQAMDQVRQVIGEIEQPRGGLLSFGIIVAIWTASVGVRSTMHALNVAYDVEESRPAWKRYPLSILYTIGLAAMLIFGVGLMLLGEDVMRWVAQQNLVGIGQLVIIVWNWVRWPVAVFLLMVAVAIVYYAAPNVDHPFRVISPGSVLSIIVWVAASLGFAYYIANFTDYSATYGSIGAIIVLLLYLFISAAVLLFGAEVNAVIEKQTGEAKERGAEPLDTRESEPPIERERGA